MKMKMTANAARHLADTLQRAPQSDVEDACFRMLSSSETGSFQLTLDKPGSQDERFEVEGSVILALAPEVAAQCEDHTLDVREQADGSKALVLV